jgi:hypothetical protein
MRRNRSPPASCGKGSHISSRQGLARQVMRIMPLGSIPSRTGMPARRASMSAPSLQPQRVCVLPLRALRIEWYHSSLLGTANPDPDDATHDWAAGGELPTVQRDDVGLGDSFTAPRLHAQPKLDARAAPVGKADVPALDAEHSTVMQSAAQQLNRPHGMLGGVPASGPSLPTCELSSSCRPPVQHC